jgi:hypothetical protein
VPSGPVPWGKWEWMRGIPILPYNWRGDTQVNTLRRAAAMLAEGKLNTRAIIGAELPYTKYAEGLDLLAAREVLKVVFTGFE